MSKKSGPRIKGLLAVAVVVGLGAGAWYHWHGSFARSHQSTDNAYVQGPVVPVVAQLPGTVVSIAAENTAYVSKGQVLVRLDPADARLTLEQAKARLAQRVREVRAMFSKNDTLTEQIKARSAEVSSAQSDVKRLKQDVERRRRLAQAGIVSAEELSRMQNQLSAARSRLRARQAGVSVARQQLLSARALTADTSIMNHPSVKNAAAMVREAMLTLDRTTILAPISGYVAKRSVQLGQRAQPGVPMLSIIPLDKVWVEANFKESQLRDIRIGQPVKLVADVYGDDVVFDGQIEGLAAGTGAAFALLPTQNASGNWIKVIQRVPVRIKLDPAQLATRPLQLGLSMSAKVKISDTTGQRLAQLPSRALPETIAASNRAYDSASLVVADIIVRNLSSIPLSLSERGTVTPSRAPKRANRPASRSRSTPANLAASSRSLQRSKAVIKAARQSRQEKAKHLAATNRGS